MSTQISIISESGVKCVQLQVSQFTGPADRGLMLQLTQGFGTTPDEPGFIQLTRSDVEKLIPILLKWLNMTDPPGSGFEHWHQTFWKYGSSTDLVRARRAYEAARFGLDRRHRPTASN